MGIWDTDLNQAIPAPHDAGTRHQIRHQRASEPDPHPAVGLLPRPRIYSPRGRRRGQFHERWRCRRLRPPGRSRSTGGLTFCNPKHNLVTFALASRTASAAVPWNPFLKTARHDPRNRFWLSAIAVVSSSFSASVRLSRGRCREGTRGRNPPRSATRVCGTPGECGIAGRSRCP